MPAAIVIAALIVAGAIVHPDKAAGDLWAAAALIAAIGVALVLLPRGDR